MLQLKGGVPASPHTLPKPRPLHRVDPKPGSPRVLAGQGGCANFTMPKPKMQLSLSPPLLRAEGIWYFPVPCEETAGREGSCHISTYSRARPAQQTQLPAHPGRTMASVGWRREHNTFLVLLHDRGRRRSYFHGEAIGSAEGVAVSNDESPWLPVLQQCNGCRRGGKTSELAQ